jgi:LuxR family maltose regulon positive regulatory protein
VRRDTVTPRRILDLFGEFQPGGVWLVHAPAGFGKTTSLGQIRALLAERDHRSGWITLDDSDSDPKTFLTYARAAVRMAAGQEHASAANAAQESFYLSPGEMSVTLINRLCPRPKRSLEV